MHISVVGAGVMGTWIAYQLLNDGHQVTLYEAYYPGHTRSSSGGESRLIRGIYGKDEIYMDWVQYSLQTWKELQTKVGQQLFYSVGCLWLFGSDTEYGDYAFKYLQRIGWPIKQLAKDRLTQIYPQINLEDIEKTYYEPDSGYLMARLGCQLLKRLFVNLGGKYVEQRILINEHQINQPDFRLDKNDQSDIIVLACGPWLKGLLPNLLGRLLMISRQEIYYFTSPTASDTHTTAQLPSWIDLSSGNYYGVPISDQRGFKIADDTRRKDLQVDEEDRIPDLELIALAKEYLRKRFPLFAEPLLSEARVCQYTNTTDGNFLLDFHPENDRIIIAGGGCGHAYKLGPSVGKYVSELIGGHQKSMTMFSFDRLSEDAEFQSQFKRKNSFF